MSSPLTAMFHKSTEVDIEDSKLTNSGRDTTYNVQNNYIIGVFPDAISYIKTAVQYFVPWTNRSTGADGDPLPQAAAIDCNLQSSMSDPVEIGEIMPPDPVSLPVASIADRYTRSMLECLVGYPLYIPKPFSEFSKEYLLKGVNVGDVGFVRKDGAFDFLFNICPPHNDSINPPNLPDGFSLETSDHSATRGDLEPLQPNICLCSQTVRKTEPAGEYICRGTDGAVLVLPEGAIQDEATNISWFKDLAERQGVEWYKYTMDRGRSISNGSLYLVTSFTKCTQWGMAVFDRPCDPGQALTFASGPLGWEGSGALTSRAFEANTPNQCVFLQGYKIMIREDIFNNLPKRKRATRIRGGGGTGLASRIKKILTGGSSLSRTAMSNAAKSEEVVLHANFNSSPVHPSDLINVALLRQNPEAKIALTHDNVWCDLLRDNFPTLNYVKLRNIARSYTSTIDAYGCVSLKKTSDPETESSGLQESIQDRGEHNPDVSIPAQTSSTLRPRSIDNSPGDRAECNPSISVPQAPPITQEPHKQGHSDARSWEVRDRKYSISIAPPALDHSIEKGKGKRLEPAIPNTETSGYRTQVQVGNASQSQLHHKAILANAANAHNVMQRKTTFQNAQNVNISDNPSFQNNVTNVYKRGIDGLKFLDGFISFDAQFAQYPTHQCHPGTHQNVLKRIRDWIDNPNSTERIFWLYGPAGAGKSAIAQTIAHSYTQSTVAATFFFFRSDLNRNNGNRLFTTLAYQLARSIPGIRDHISRSLYERPDLPRADVETQFKHLVAQPFWALNKDVTQQKLAPVIIIDGVDECTDENLQQRFLKVISDAVKDNDFPLRFLICSRPELHIEQTIRRVQNQTPVRSIDLAKLDDANRDIERYLVGEFSRIASEQGLDPAWPGQNIIDDIVYKSSGNFIFVFVVIKFVGDSYCFAKAQLEIILNMKPPKTTSPFSALDQLFLEILRRVPGQDFLKRYLAILTARISVSGSYGDLYKDDAVLMHVSEEELYANLRRMRSLLTFDARIDVHHRSFLDFLHDSSRSMEYYVGIQGGIRRYLCLFVDSLVRYVVISMEQSDRHNGPHFTPNFRAMIKNFPPKIELPRNEWWEVIRPLLDLQDKLLQLPTNSATTQILRCDDCTVFNLLREFLHLGLHLGYKGQTNNTSARSVMKVRMRQGIISATTKLEKRNSNDLDSIFLSLFAHLPAIMNESWSPNGMVIKLMSNILQFNSTATEMAQSVRFVSDAQKLVDLLVYLIDEKNILSSIRPNVARKATLLALEIFARVPILPLASFLNGNSRVTRVHFDLERYIDFPIQILSQTIIASRVLDRRYIVPMRVIDVGKEGFMLVNDGNDLSMKQWRQKTKILNSVMATQVMLELAKAIQYFHSTGVVLHRGLSSDDVFFDSDLCPRICCFYSTSQFLLDEQCKETFSREDNTFSFGCLLYELFSEVDTKPSLSIRERRAIITKRPSVLPGYAWQLIQGCCAEHPKTRPTINEVVDEMASWHIK